MKVKFENPLQPSSCNAYAQPPFREVVQKNA